jgi:hypothetical protein
MRFSSRPFAAGVTAGLLLLLLPLPLTAGWQLTTEDGSSKLKLGLLVQARAEALDTSDGADTSQNLFLRRFRLLAGGSLGERWSFFIETDSPNLGRGEVDGTKNASDLFVQDLVVTYRASDALFLDAGQLLIENSYNSNQSAASLMTTDYGPYTFVDNGPLDERVGRDYGVRLRGYLAGDHLEVRAGLYQGQRGDDSTHSLRFTGRVMVNVFEAQKGYFYQGTSLGKKKILSFGVSYDTQEGYDALGADAYLDLPLGGGDGLTLQADWVRFDGGDFLPAFPRQETLLLEAGYYVARARLQPFVQYSERNFDPLSLADQEKAQAGLAFYFDGHGRNLKLSWGRYSVDGGPDRDEVWINFQLFTF